MSAPANDNFASAYAISGDSGYVVATNTEATAEAGEPANHGRTVWFNWTAPNTQSYYFSTRFAGAFTTAPNFDSNVQVFTGSAVGSLTEVAYAINWHDGFATEHGSMVVFNATAGTTYRIRVDSRTTGGATGDAPLNWDVYYPLFLAACGDCQPQLGAGEECVGVFHVDDLLVSKTLDFGDQPKGIYRMRYCCGYFGEVVVTILTFCINDESTCTAATSRMYSTGHNISLTTSAGKKYVNDSTSSTSFATAELNALCDQLVTTHTGGTIRATFDATHGIHNTWSCNAGGGCPNDPNVQGDGYPYYVGGGPTPVNSVNNPTWGVYRVTPAIDGRASHGTKRIACTDNYSSTFVLTNLGYVRWGGVTCRVLNEGEVTGAASTAVSIPDIPASRAQVQTPAFTWSRTNSLGTQYKVTLEITITSVWDDYLADYVTLASLGLPPYVMRVEVPLGSWRPTGFHEDGTTATSRTGDHLSVGFKVAYATQTLAVFNGCGYTFELQNSGGIQNASAAVTLNTSTGSFTATFTFDAAVAGATNLVATIIVRDENGQIAGTLTYDLTPIVTITLTTTSTPYDCGGATAGLFIDVTNHGLGPTNALVLSKKSGTVCFGPFYSLSFPVSIGALAAGATASYGLSHLGITQMNALVGTVFGAADGATTYPDATVT